MRRFQTKSNPEKDWTDPGPDLLRTRPNAKKRIKDDLQEYGGGWWVRSKTGDEAWSKWRGPFDRAEILDGFDDWNPPDKTYAQWGRKDADGKVAAKGAVKARSITVKDYSGASDHTNTTIALCEAAFPKGAFGGAFVCKQISGSSSWSNHAFGKAYDHSAYDENDALTDWLLRMARENAKDDIQLPVWQILGSKNGNVGNGNNSDGDWIGGFEWSAGGCDSSHEWHAHIDTGKKDPTGTPPCAQKAGPLETPEVDPHDATDAEEE